MSTRKDTVTTDPADPSAPDADVEILARERSHDGYFRLDTVTLRHRRHDGEMSGPLRRELFYRGPIAAVLLYDPVRDEVVMVEQFRLGAFEAGQPPWLLEIVAGMVDEGEDVETCARREAVEETGLEVQELEKIHAYLVSPGGSDETADLFVGRVDASGAGGLFGNDHEGEDIKVVTLSSGKALARLNAGRISNAMTIVALQWLALNREALRDRWLGK